MTDEPDLIIRMSDLRKSNGCSRKARDFFARQDLDWLDFIQNGIPAKTLIDTGDAQALHVVEVARGREE